MKKLYIPILMIICCLPVLAQDITGRWYGALNIGNQRLKVIFNIKQTGQDYSSTMDSPDQNVKGIPVKNTTFTDRTLEIEIPQLSFLYKGSLIGTDSIEGRMTQHGQSFNLNLTKRNILEQKPNRPQEPKKPYPYVSEEISFRNEKEGFTLAGTLTLPKDKQKSPAVVLVSGSGLQDRNEEIFNHKPFLVIADYLTRNGIAVLRYDDRGCGESTGDPRSATTTDFAVDAQSAVNYLKTREEIDAEKIGLIGHSEGGTIAFMLAAKENTDLSFIVSMAGSSIQGDSLLLLQRELVFRTANRNENDIQKEKAQVRELYKLMNANRDTDAKTLKEKIISSGIFPNTPEYNSSLDAFTRPWIRFFVQYDPTNDLQKIKSPVFAINGEKDIQVPATENLNNIQTSLEKGGNTNFKIKEYPKLNHLFQTSATGSIEEYGKIEETISPVVLGDIVNWIMDVTK